MKKLILLMGAVLVIVYFAKKYLYGEEDGV